MHTELLPLEIKIVRTPANFNGEWSDSIEYKCKPFSVYINGKEIENLKRFALDWDIDRFDAKHLTLKEWNYIVEQYFPFFENQEEWDGL